MVSIDRVRRGMSQYLDKEIIPKMTGWQKWVYGAGAAAYLSKLDEIAEKVHDDPTLSVLHIVDDDHNVDIDTIYSLIREQARKCNADIRIPMMGIITLSVQDVDEMYSMINNA